MRLERSRNTRRNIIVGEIDKITGILMPFIVRTMIIHLLGASYLGLTGLFYSIIQMLNLSEMGFGMAITYSMYLPIANNDGRMINALLKFYARVYRIVAMVMGAAGLVIMFFLPSLIRGDIPDGLNIYLLYLIYLGDACLNCLLFPDRKALLAAHQRDDVSGRVHILTQALMYSAQIVCIGLARNFYLYAFTVPLSTIAYNLLCAAGSRRLFGQYRKEGELEGASFREIKRQVAGLMVRKLASLSRNAFDSMFISAFLGLQLTAVYGNYYYVMDAVVMLLAVIKTSMAGGVGNSIAMETVEKNRRDMGVINFLFMLVSGWCTVCLVCLYQPFMNLWAGKQMTLQMPFAVVFAVYFYILKMSDIRTLYAESVGLWWQSRYLSVAEALSNLALNWLLVRSLGLMGILLASMISYFVFNFIGGAVVLYRHYYSFRSLPAYFGSHVRYALITGMISCVTFFATERIPVPGFAGLLLRGCVCVLLPGILYWILYRHSEEWKGAEPLLRRLLARHA